MCVCVCVPLSPLSVVVRGGHHLWEVDQRHMILVVDHQVELVEVAVDQAVIGQFDQQLHELVEEGGRVVQLPHLTPARQQHTHTHTGQPMRRLGSAQASTERG